MTFFQIGLTIIFIAALVLIIAANLFFKQGNGQ